MNEPARNVFLGVLMVSLAMLGLETLLPRVYAVYVGPNFVFFSISIALVGLSSGGIIASVWERRFSDRPQARLAMLALFFSATTLGAIWLTHFAGGFLNEAVDARYAAILATTKQGSLGVFSRSVAGPSMVFVLFTGLVMAVPFLFAGLCISLAFRFYSKAIGKIYAFDLFGAALGCVFTVAALTWLSATNGCLLTSLFGAVAALLFSLPAEPERRAALALSATAVAVLGGLVALGVAAGPPFEFRIHKYAHLRSFYDGPLDETQHQWTALGRIALVERVWSPSWNKTPRVRPKHMVAMDLGGHSVLESFTPENLEVIKHTSVFSDEIMEPIVVPGFYRDLRDYLVLLAGNGQDMMRAYAWYGDKIRLDGVELNPVVYNFGFDYAPANLGAFFRKPNVKMNIDEGRSFVEKTAREFDMILLSYSGATFATGTGSLSSTPQFLFTKEAFVTYLKKLRPAGVLVVAGGAAPGGLPESLWSFYAALKEVEPDARVQERVLCYRRKGATDSEYYAIYHRSALSRQDVERIAGVLDSHDLELTYSAYTPSPHPKMEAFRAARNPGVADGPFAFRALAEDRVHTDDRPFFYFDLVWGSIGGYLVIGYVATLISAMAVAVLFLLVPLLLRREQEQAGGRAHWSYFLAFAMMGAGFMLIEVGSIQKFELFLGSPQLTLAVILASLLLFTGAGSYYSGRLYAAGFLTEKRAALLIVLYGLFVLLFLNRLIYRMMALSLPAKIAVIAAVLFPLGFLLGTLFPQFVRRLEPDRTRFIPVAWATNGVFSVAASNLGAILYLFLGANSVVLLGLLCYAALGLSVPALAGRTAAAR